jgi:glycosyltransferase involved in cell wall biosynthesis
MRIPPPSGSEDRVKLLYVFPEPLPLDRARGIQSVHTVAAIARQGIAVVLAHVPAADDPFTGYAVERPSNVSLLPISHRLPWPLSRVHSNRVFASRLVRQVHSAGIGAIVARHLKAARFLLDQLPRIPLVYEAHEVFADTVSPASRVAEVAELERSVVSRAAGLIANSGATATRLAERYQLEKPIHVIPNGVEYPDTVAERDWNQAARHVIYAGSFFGWKGVDDLIAAAGGLSGFHIKLLGGDQASIARLRGASVPGGAELEFTGRVSHRDVARELQQACIAVLPNRADPDSAFTSPIKLFEYMAAGCALVVTDLPSLHEILAADEAVWVRPGDPAALAEGIRSLAAEPERARAMAARVREKARNYTWRARGERLAGVVRPWLA